MELKDLKSRYSELAKRHKLPSFIQVNENFEIDKIDKDTECLLRLVRKVAMEKIVNSLNFLEILLNPVNAPRIYLSYIRSINAEDRKSIEKIYSAFGALSINSLDLEIDYSEKKEAEMIKSIYNIWMSLKGDFRKILASLKQPNGFVAKREKSYFG